MCRQQVDHATISLSIAVALALAVACSPPDASRADSVPESPPPATASRPSDWVAQLGDLLVVPGDGDHAGVVLFPETPSAGLISSAPLTLVRAAGDSSSSTRATLAVSDSQVCGEAATVQLSGDVPAGWSVGLLARSVAAVRMDALEAMPSVDSAELVASIARLASAVPVSRESRFGGLPFVVLHAHRFEAQGQQVLVAHIVRRLPQEATPLEEHTLLVAERPLSGRGVPYATAYHARSEGTEETAEHFEVLAAVRAGESTLLLIAREQVSRDRYEILARARNGEWRPRWSRTLAC